MRYHSTRTYEPTNLLNFEDTVLTGLAPDGGLYIPEQIPQLDEQTLKSWESLSFQELCKKLFRKFINPSEISDEELSQLVDKSFSTFSHPEITPTVKLTDTKDNKSLYCLELFHGPTYAFKDVALQFLGNLFEFFLTRKNQASQSNQHKVTVVGATSGDTGGAAIYGLRGKKNVEVFMLHPEGRVSRLQEAQMTQVMDENVHNISIEGAFDDCQNLVKQCFGDAQFKKDYQLGAVNSINWARILAQISYYFYSYFQLRKQGIQDHIIFSVPTGNFGDILAGYYAKRMGLNIERLVTATNENDILYTFFTQGTYKRDSSGVAKATHSPAMDILVSSNFERFLWYLAYTKTEQPGAACEQVNAWMEQFRNTYEFSIDAKLLETARIWFDSYRVDDSTIISTIKKYYQDVQPRYLLDPHTAVGVNAAELYPTSQPTHFVCVGTAHPAKFSEALILAISPEQQAQNVQLFDFDAKMGPEYLPKPFRNWMNPDLPRKNHKLPSADVETLKSLIKSVVKI
jgi:threonine synthase